MNSVDKLLTRADLSPDQGGVFDGAMDWLSSQNRHPLLRIGGFAGTGKSSILGVLAAELSKRKLKIAYVSLTGRAASVLGRKLKACTVKSTAASYTSNKKLIQGPMSNLYYGDGDPEIEMPYCGTIHRLLYRPIIDRHEKLCGWAKRETLDRNYDLIIIDEASMISGAMLEDLQVHGRPILAVGDHGQLAPVMGSSELMENPDLVLEKIHRQAEDNPIIAYSKHIREGGKLAQFKHEAVGVGRTIELVPKGVIGSVLRRAYAIAAFDPDLALNVASLCWMNKTRRLLNVKSREARGIAQEGKPGELVTENDVVICLKNGPPIYNGMRGLIRKTDKGVRDWQIGASLSFPDERIDDIRARMVSAQFLRENTFSDVTELRGRGINVDKMSDAGDYYDFGYACTVHKFQGSAVPHVIFYVDMQEKPWNDEWRRFAYTAVTRASERLTVLL